MLKHTIQTGIYQSKARKTKIRFFILQSRSYVIKFQPSSQ